MAASKAAAKAKPAAKKAEKKKEEEHVPTGEAGSVSPDPVAHAYNNDPTVGQVQVDQRPEHYTPAHGEPKRNGFVDVVAGEHKGRYGVYVDDFTGSDPVKPDLIVINTRDDDAMTIQVKYDDCVASEPGHR